VPIRERPCALNTFDEDLKKIRGRKKKGRCEGMGVGGKTRRAPPKEPEKTNPHRENKKKGKGQKHAQGQKASQKPCPK